MVLPIYLSKLTHLIILTFDLLLVPFSCLSYLDLLMIFTPTKIQAAWFSYWKVLVYSVWLTTCMYNCCYGNEYNQFIGTIFNGFTIYNYEKLVDIREWLEWLAPYWLNHPFLTDTGTPLKKHLYFMRSMMYREFII